MYPILIGSNALKYYGIVNQDYDTDYDLILTLDMAKDICFLADKKEKNICWFNNKRVDLVITKNINSSDDIILTELNKMAFILNLQTVKLFEKFSVLVAPLEILYSIKKSHVHRIIPISSNNLLNAKIWNKQMKYYTDMRNKLGYEKMDKIIYGEKKYGNPLDNEKFECESDLDFLTRIVFVKRFKETNERVPDTKVSMDQNLNQFFDDNVVRFIEHDELHKKVGLIYRNNDEQLFHKFQKDKNNACLDKEMFFNGEYNDRIQLFREEIMVLFLERKVIPELMLCFKKPRIKFNGFDESVKREEFAEVIAHFVTNLCDCGHSWLRQYILDHYTTYCDYNSFEIEKIYGLGCKITNIYNEAYEEKYINIMEELNSYNGYNNKYFNKMNEKLDGFRKWNKNEKILELNLGIYQNNEKISKKIIKIGSYDFCNVQIINYPSNIKKFLYKMEEELLYLASGNEKILYCSRKNIGILFGSRCELFNIKLSHSKNKNNVVINLNLVENDIKNEYVNEYNKRFKTYYYHSSDCTEFGSEEREAKYLSSFGFCPGILGQFTEELARLYLDVARDDEYGSSGDASGSDGEYNRDNVYNE